MNSSEWRVVNARDKSLNPDNEEYLRNNAIIVCNEKREFNSVECSCWIKVF